MFRVYTGPDGEPAGPKRHQHPFKPKWHFPVSLQGVKEERLRQVMGYPDSTDRFLSNRV
ncbi:MAG: S46 family peptidase [Flavobacteriales bacterium]|nr:S46 family peptidase [Flavobacteriales bacterium]